MCRHSLLLIALTCLSVESAVTQPTYEEYENKDLAWMRGTGGGPINRIIAHPDGKHLIVALTNIQVFDLEKGDVVPISQIMATARFSPRQERGTSP